MLVLVQVQQVNAVYYNYLGTYLQKCYEKNARGLARGHESVTRPPEHAHTS